MNAAEQFNLGGTQILSNRGNGNLFIGINTGTPANSAGQINTFVGTEAGYSNTTGVGNSFFGVDAGPGNTTGSQNSFYGVTAGYSNIDGSWNSFFGRAAAMRIIATRLYDWLNPAADGAVGKPKDPMEHVRILRYHQKAAADDSLAVDYGVLDNGTKSA